MTAKGTAEQERISVNQNSRSRTDIPPRREGGIKGAVLLISVYFFFWSFSSISLLI